GIVFTDEDKAEAFADSLELQCRTDMGDADDDHIELVEDFARDLRHTEPEPDEAPLRSASPAEIRQFIDKLK
ncbi:hypothetical protein BDFB_014997, partial [Asbolus verrucosus]